MKQGKGNNIKLMHDFERLLDYLLGHLEKEHLDPKSKAEIVKEAIKATFKGADTRHLDIPVEIVELRDTLGKETDRGSLFGP